MNLVTRVEESKNYKILGARAYLKEVSYDEFYYYVVVPCNPLATKR